MALPVNKPTLDSKIATDLANNSTQAITAQVLRNTLNPIVNSTFGLKTIWSGYVYCRRAFQYSGASGEDETGVFVQERYYDPNYFPALDPNSLDTISYPLANYQASGCRYKLTNVGSTLNNGTFYNVGTQIKNTTENTAFVGTGLTFDVKVEAGTVVAIKVNNPGTGYCWGRYGGSITGPEQNDFRSTIVEIQLDYTGSGFRPQVTLDLSRVIDLDRKYTAFTEGKYLNLFVPSAGLTIGYGGVISTGNEFTNVETGANSKNAPGTCDHDVSFNTYYPNLTNSPTIKGYYQSNFFTGSASLGAITRKGYSLEVKVPIINTTI